MTEEVLIQREYSGGSPQVTCASESEGEGEEGGGKSECFLEFAVSGEKGRGDGTKAASSTVQSTVYGWQEYHKHQHQQWLRRRRLHRGNIKRATLLLGTFSLSLSPD